MARIRMIHHVNVQISDRERTRDWYERVLDAEYLDRGPALNKRQLQLRIGTGEMHFTDTPDPSLAPAVHFAVEVGDWDGMLAHLGELGIPHSRTSGSAISASIGGTDPRQGRREDNDEHYTYIHDPDGSLIELVYHPLGLEDSEGNRVEPAPDLAAPRWTQLPGFSSADIGGPSS